MKNLIMKLGIISVILTLSTTPFVAETYYGTDAILDGDISYLVGAGREDIAVATIREYNAPPSMITRYMDMGYLSAYVDEFKAEGRIPQDYVHPNEKSTPTTTTVEPVKTEPEAFTIVDCEPYSAWAIQKCNIRKGASTQYEKVGSLTKDEEVTVTGVATTKWFRIKTADGSEAYVSDTLLTTNRPFQEETTEEVTTTEEETVTEEVTTVEETVEEETTEEVTTTEEETTEAIEDVSTSTGIPMLYIIIAAAILVVIVGTVLGVVIYKKNHKILKM